MENTHHVVCPACSAINKVPTARLTERPNCGKCHRQLFTGKPLKLGEEDFDRHARRSEVPLLVDFWAPWCGPCRTMAPAFEQAAEDLEPRIRLAKVNTEEEQRLAARYGIRGIPTLILFEGGRELTRQSGAMDRDAIVQWVRSAMH